MRSRNIKPGFFKNEELASCSLHARLLFIGLWCMADRDGRLEKRPLRIKAEVFPYDSLDINGELTVLERNGFIQTYVVDGKEYLQVVNFLEHQRPHHTEAKSKLPAISDGSVLTVKSPLSHGEYPPDSLIPDSLIQEEKPLPASRSKKDDDPEGKFIFDCANQLGISSSVAGMLMKQDKAKLVKVLAQMSTMSFASGKAATSYVMAAIKSKSMAASDDLLAEMEEANANRRAVNLPEFTAVKDYQAWQIKNGVRP